MGYVFFSLWLIFRLGAAATADVLQTPDGDPKALVVVVHGCLQDASALAYGSGFKAIGDTFRLAVWYPDAPRGSNADGCWNWFLPENQNPNSGQLLGLHEKLNLLKKEHHWEGLPTYILGISSGAATVAGLLSCFPFDFKGGALIAGVAYGLAKSATEALKILKLGPPDLAPEDRLCNPKSFNGQLVILQGAQDPVVNPRHADFLVKDFIGETTAKSTTSEVVGGLNTTTEIYLSPRGGKAVKVMVEGLGHAWPGYKSTLPFGDRLANSVNLPFFDSRGPNASETIWRLFAEEPTSSGSPSN